MERIAKVLLCVATFLISQSAAAQEVQPLATLPAVAESMSLAGGSLQAYSAGTLLTAQFLGDDVAAFVTDTTFVKINQDVNYIVCHPVTGDYYFTAVDRKGRSRLYMAHREPHRYKVTRLKMDDVDVFHPTFNAEGDIMVFCSRERRRSYGGYDLWYTRFKNGEWQEPHNIGNRLNSRGDELSPWIAGDYLFFASDGRDDSRGHMAVYATRLIAREVIGDTVGMLQIGRSRVQQLPLCLSDTSCHDFVVDSARRCCWWIDDAAGLKRYQGALQAVTYWGYTYDKDNQPLPGVNVVAYEADREVASTVSDTAGFYRFTLPAGRTFRVVYRLKNRFVHQYTLATLEDPVNLIGEEQHDAVLDALPVGRPLYLTDLFGPDAVVDLSAHGIETLQPLVAFLTDNPHLRATLTLVCDLTTDAEFNALLTGQRLQVLEDYLREALPAGLSLAFRNGCEGRQGHSDATGLSRLMVMMK